MITVKDWNEGVELANRIAAEHLEIITSDPETLAERVRHAGAIFQVLGRRKRLVTMWPANHVLPTARTSRFSSGLGVLDFMKRTTMVHCDADALANIVLQLQSWQKLKGYKLMGFLSCGE